MTSRRNILGLISLSTFLPFITKATEDTCSRQSTLERKSKEFEKLKNKVRYPVSESNESTVCRLLKSSKTNKAIAFYYHGGTSRRHLRLVSIESVFRLTNSPHTYVSAYCHLRHQNRVFRVDKIALA